MAEEHVLFLLEEAIGMLKRARKELLRDNWALDSELRQVIAYLRGSYNMTKEPLRGRRISHGA